MGYHKYNIKMMKQLKQLQGIPLHMSCIWPPSCYWTDFDICHHKLSTIIIELGQHNPQP